MPRKDPTTNYSSGHLFPCWNVCWDPGWVNRGFNFWIRIFEWSSWTGFLFSFFGFLYSCDNLSNFMVFLWAIPLFILSKRNIALCSLNCVGIIKGQSFLSYSPGFRNAYWQNLLRGKSQCSRKPLFLPPSPHPMTQLSASPPGWHGLSQPMGGGHGEDILSWS